MVSFKTRLLIKPFIPLCAAVAVAVQSVDAAKLDINSSVDVKSISNKNMNFAAPAYTSNESFWVENAWLKILIKNMKLESTSETSMDLGIALRAIGIAGSTTTAAAPFSSAESRYPNIGMTPFFDQAYVKVNRIFTNNFSIVAGKQPYTLASGLVLSDDGNGFTGVSARYSSLWRNSSVSVFAFQPKAGDLASGGVNVRGIEWELPLEGLWHFYVMQEVDFSTKTYLNRPVSQVNRNFLGTAYILKHGSLTFEGEAALQTGTAYAEGQNSNVSIGGSAFILSGKWEQPMGRLGTGTARMAIGRGSGKKIGTTDTDEAFFPSYGHRYSGIERSGFGEIMGASLYDAWGGDPTTKNGLPSGLSGIQVINLGATLPPFRDKYYLDIDFYSFEADTSTGENRKLGNEWDFHVTYPIGAKYKIQACYAVFTPGKAYPEGTQTPTKIGIAFQANF